GPKANATAALIEALSDADAKVQQGAIEALGALKAKEALPAIIALAEKNKFRKETLAALSNMPDPAAIPVLVAALNEKSSGTRRSILKALKTMAAQALPLIEERLASGKIPKEFEPEIQSFFHGGAITKWKMIGPFENVWEATHPPEVEALAGGSFIGKKYLNAEGKEVGWNDVSGDPQEGHVDLEKVYHSNGMVCAYAYAEIEAPEAADARVLCGADDQIAIWLNGAKVINVPGSHGYEVDKQEAPIHLNAGKNRLLVKIGNLGGGWEFAARIPGLDGNQFVKSKEATPEEKQRLFAMASKADGAWVNAGDAVKGAKVFADTAGPLGGICATCHAVAGKGGQIGPDLSAVAVNYKRADLITSIHEPSKTIALGFEQAMIETKGGETFAGALRSDTAEALTLVGADAVPHVIKKADVKTQTHIPTSLMPPGLTNALKPQEFADLLAYLETLRGK
ncbi:MAG: Heme-binding protein, partial [Acidimicrobiales bacterium]|nr:Heme-binding protein [Acidimicrobiales bacterium]